MPTGAQRDGAGGPRSPSGWRVLLGVALVADGLPERAAVVALVAGAALELAALPFAVAGWRASVAAGLSRQSLRGWLDRSRQGPRARRRASRCRPPSS